MKRKGSVEISKIKTTSDVEEERSFWNWFPRKRRQYSSVRLYLVRMDKHEQFLRVVAVRDSFVSLHLIQMHMQTGLSSIRIIAKTQHFFNCLITKYFCVFQKIFQNEPHYTNLYLAFQTKNGRISIYRININFQQISIFTCTQMIEDIIPCEFQMGYFNGRIYYSIYNPFNSQYEVFGNKVQYLVSQINEKVVDQIPIYRSKYRTVLASGQDKMIVFSTKFVYWVTFQEQESDFSEQQRIWLSFRDTVALVYSKKIRASSDSLEQIGSILVQKESKLVNWCTNRFETRSYQQKDLQITEIIGIQIVVTNVMKILFQSFNLINGLRQYVQTLECSEIAILAANCQPRQIVKFLNKLIQIGYQQVLRVLVKKTVNLNYQGHCVEGIRTIFQEPISIYFQKLTVQRTKIQILKEFIGQIFDLQLLEVHYLIPLINFQQKTFVKQFIIGGRLWKYFIYFFVGESLEFTYIDLRRLCKGLRGSSKLQMQRFCCQLLKVCKTKYVLNNTFIYSRLDILIDGLINYYDELEGDIHIIFPGLAFFFYIKRGQRKAAFEWMEASELKFEKINHLKLVFMSVFDCLHKKKTESQDSISIFLDLMRQSSEFEGNMKLLIQHSWSKGELVDQHKQSNQYEYDCLLTKKVKI